MSTTTPGPDEKVCPFCAETIKRAAIKCRYCGSELPADAPAVEALPEPPVTLEKEKPADDVEAVAPAPPPVPSARTSSQSLLASFRTTITLLVVCVLLAAGTAVVWYRSNHGSEPAAKGAITSTGARDAGLQAAATLTQRVFSYNWTTFDADAKKSEQVLTPSFRREYSSTLAKARTKAITNQVKQVAKVSSTSVVTASSRKVEALVFMNIVTTGKTGTQNLTTSRLVVTLTRDRGEWRISDLEPI